MSDMQRLKTLVAEVDDLANIANLVEWDQSVYMPRGGGEARADHLATLRRLQHEKFTSDEMGRLLGDLGKSESGADPDSDDACLLRVVRDDYDRTRKLPAAFVAEMVRHVSLSQEAWIRARNDSDFRIFRPALEKMVELKRQQAELLGPTDCLYDALLHEFEPFMKTAHLRTVFDGLKAEIVPLVAAIAKKSGAVDDAFLHQPFDVDRQKEFIFGLVREIGFDFERGRCDLTVHPFCTCMSRDDVRLATRFDPQFLNTALFGTIHEAGHGMYNQGFGPSLYRTTLAAGASLGVHESQSRFWENVVARSRGFWKYAFPLLQTSFPHLAGVPLESFYRAINKVGPSLIRVEADELTYSLHIMLRFEMEQDLLDGCLCVADAPEAWNARMKEYLGVTPPDDKSGILQDIHWSLGYIAYFPTYALGNILSVQLYEKAVAEVPEIPDAIEAGRFAPLLGWLRENVHRHGRKHPPTELIRRVTGGALDPGPYIRYLKTKLGAIYGV